MIASIGIPKTRNNKESIFKDRRFPVYLCLVVIILLSAFLRFYQLGYSGYGNTYYAATVKSMLTSWHNFFFASYEPGGSVTVDKPPLGFWIQAAFAWMFGVNGFVLAFPQATAGVLSVLIMFFLVRRAFGDWGGLLASAVLAVTPVAVATDRNNTIDGMLVLVLLLAAWAFLESVRKGGLIYLLLGAFLVGLGFNIKMLQAWMPLPAFFLIYLLAAPHRWWKKLLHLAAASVLLIVVSFSWAVTVDLTPVDERPYIGSSTENSVMELITGHNGLRRLIRIREPRQIDPPPNSVPPVEPFQPVPPLDRANATGQVQQDALHPGGGLPVIPRDQPQRRPENPQAYYPLPGVHQGKPGLNDEQSPSLSPEGWAGNSTQPGSKRTSAPGPQRPGMGNEVGQAGITRLFTQPLVEEAGWLLPAGLAGVILVLVTAGLKRPWGETQWALVLWGGWLIPVAVYFTFTSGLFHAYYLVMLGPPLAALVAGAFWSIARMTKENRWLGVGLTALVFLGVALVQVSVLRDYAVTGSWPVVFFACTGVCGLSFLAWNIQGWQGKAAAVTLSISLLMAPLAWSVAVALDTHPDTALPTANRQRQEAIPGGVSQPAGNRPDRGQEIVLNYLLENSLPDGYLVATVSSHEASGLILETGRPVLTFGGFNGQDDVVDIEQLEEMVAGGEVRFVLLNEALQQQKPQIAAWVRSNCSLVKLPGTIKDPARVNRPPVSGTGIGADIALLDCGGFKP